MQSSAAHLRKFVASQIIFGAGARHSPANYVQAMGIDTRGMTGPVLKSQVGRGSKLAPFGVHSSDIPSLSRNAILDPCILTNPCKTNLRDVEVVYEEAL